MRGSCRSAIIPVCRLLPGEVRLTKHFLELAIGTQQTARFSVSGGLTISTGKAAADPANLGEFMSAGLRLRQHAIDYKDWDDDDGYIDVYLHRFIAFDAMFNWKAIAAFDTRFRLEKASSRPGSISSWKDPAIELTQTYFTFNPPAPAPAPASASSSIERKIEAAGLSASAAEGCSPHVAAARCLRNYQVRGRRRDDVAAADSARRNNNSALPTKLLELSSWDFLHSNSFSFASGTTP